MKITFCQNDIQETEKTDAEKAYGGRRVKNEKTPSAFPAQGAVYTEGGNSFFATGKGEKGKSLIDIRQEAERIDADVRQDYMTLMSNIMSEKDYAKLQEEGFEFRYMEPDEAVNIVDRIKVELARAGKEIKGYNDDLDVETLAAVLGSMGFARTVNESFREADLPVTTENAELVKKAWDMAQQLEPMDEGASRYIADNGLGTEIWAQNSGAGASGAAVSRYCEEDIEGYYVRNADPAQTAKLSDQIDQVIVRSGREVTEESRWDAEWLLKNGLPLTEENLDRLDALKNLSLPVTQEAFARAAADAISGGKDPVYADLGGEHVNLYEKAAEIEEYYNSDETWEKLAGDVTARRQLEEIRLMMTAEVNVKLLKSGFSIDTAPMEELVEALKRAEKELAQQYFPQDDRAVEKYRSFNLAARAAQEMPSLPAAAVGALAQDQQTVDLNGFYSRGQALKEEYQKAGESYETLMTMPRADLGDSIKKAFSNVDDILKDLGEEQTEEARRAVRILGYNRMEITPENLKDIMEADRQVRNVVEKLTPAAVLKMIRDGVNPLEKSFGELEEYFDRLPEEYNREAESYSRFLYGLEKNGSVTEEEKESYIGIYRLLRQIERTDGAVIGALVNAQAELHFSNLLSAVRSGKVRSVDVKIADDLGTVAELVKKGESISDQIGRAFIKNVRDVLTGVSDSGGTGEMYLRQELEELRTAAEAAEGESMAMLQRGQISPTADNLMAAQALLSDESNIFAPYAGKKANSGTSGEKGQNVTGGEKAKDRTAEDMGCGLWEMLDDESRFSKAYDEAVLEAGEALETETFEEADTSIDVRGMQLLHKQLNIAASLAREEEYFLPLYVGDTLTRVHLVIDRSAPGQGSVQVGVKTPDGSGLDAQFHLDDGLLNGIFKTQSENEVMKLQELADIFKEDAKDLWRIGTIEVSSSDSAGVTERDAAGGKAESAELYRVAKIFLQALQKRGM